MTSDAHMEATHLRELLATARLMLFQAGYTGATLAEQLDAIMRRAKEAEFLQKELAKLQELVAQLRAEDD